MKNRYDIDIMGNISREKLLNCYTKKLLPTATSIMKIQPQNTMEQMIE